MKKTITLLAILLVTITSSAFNSKLILRVPADRASLEINGQRFITQNGEFRINKLRQGRHFFNLSTRQNRNFNGNRNPYYRRGRSNHIRGKIFIPRDSRVFARVTPSGRLIVDQVVPIRRNRPTPRAGNGRDFGNNRNYRVPNYYSRDLPQEQFRQTLQIVRNANFEKTKLSIAREYIFTNRVTSNQLLRLMQAMNFESSRLSIAKIGYRRVIDPERFFVVYRAFEFQSSIDALNRHIAN